MTGSVEQFVLKIESTSDDQTAGMFSRISSKVEHDTKLDTKQLE